MSKKEYIELAPLIQITSARMDNLRQHNSFFDHYSDGYNECIDRIMEQPTADVVEVRHGEWIKITSYPMGHKCSECGYIKRYAKPYCEICGARMDGKGGK